MEELEDLSQVIASPAYFFDMSDHRILCTNQAFVELLGFSEEELLKMTVDDLRPAEDIFRLRKALSLGPPEGAVEWRYCTRAGELLYVQITCRNSVYMDRRKGWRRDVRMVVISKSSHSPIQTADHMFG